MPIPIPSALASTIAGVYGDRGRAWVEAATLRIPEVAERWKLALEPPFQHLSYNYVAPATLPDGTHTVLKAGVPSREFDNEIAALRRFNGHGAVRVIAADPAVAALLLERAIPGSPLSTIDNDDEETRIAAAVARRLWRQPPAGHDFATLAYLFQAFQRLRTRFAGATGPLPPGLFERAEALVPKLLASSPAPMLLHGDFHHYNILRSGADDWLVIDSPGLVGDPAAEFGMFFCNPHDRIAATPNLSQLMARRIEIIAAESSLDAERIARWGMAWAMLSACWHIEDGTGGEAYAVGCAEALASLLPV